MKYHYVDSEYYYYEEWTKLVPDDTEDLVFGRDFIEDLKMEDIPYGVKNITFGAKFCSFLDKGVIPNSVENIIFEGGFYIEHFIIGSIPNSVKNLSIEEYSIPFDYGILPESIVELELGNDIDYPIIVGATQDSLSYLEFKKYLKSSDINFIPKSVSTLNLGDDFNKPIVIDTLDNNSLMLGCHVVFIPNLTNDIVCKSKKINVSPIPNNIKVIILFYDFHKKYSEICYLKNAYTIYFLDNENKKECKLFHTTQFQEELVQKVFDPIRIQKICDKYQIDLLTWINFVK